MDRGRGVVSALSEATLGEVAVLLSMAMLLVLAWVAMGG